MRLPRLHLVGFLPIMLLLVCLSSSTAQPSHLQKRSGPRIVREDNFIEARKPTGGDPTDYVYGPPPPYYTVQPAASTQSESYPPSGKSTSQASDSMTETRSFSEMGTASKMNVSSVYGTLSSGSSSFYPSSGVDIDTTMVSADSSAKASSATRSETASTAHPTDMVSPLISELTDKGASSTSGSQFSNPISEGGYSFSSTGSSLGTETTTSSSVTTATADLVSSTFLISSDSPSSITVSSIFITTTETITEETSTTNSSLVVPQSWSTMTSSLTATSLMGSTSRKSSSDYSTPGQTQSNSTVTIGLTKTLTTVETSWLASSSNEELSSEVGTEPFSGVFSSTSSLLEESTMGVASITTTTKVLNVTVAVSREASTEYGSTSLSIYPTTPTDSSRLGTSLDITTATSSFALSVSSTISTMPTADPVHQNSSQISSEDLIASAASAISGTLVTSIVTVAITHTPLTDSLFPSSDITSNVFTTRNTSVSGSRVVTETFTTSDTARADMTSTLFPSVASTGASLPGNITQTSSILSTSSSENLDWTSTATRTAITEPSSFISLSTAANGSLSDSGIVWQTSSLVISKTVTTSSIVSASKDNSVPTAISSIPNSSVVSVSASRHSGSFGESGPVISVSSTQGPSGTFFTSSTLPSNTTSGAGDISLTVTTTVKGSIVTVFPEGFPPTETDTGVSSTFFSSDTSSWSNFSGVSEDLPLISQTSLSLDWSTWTLDEPRTSEPSTTSIPTFPALTLPTSQFSVITTPLFPPTFTSTWTETPSDSTDEVSVLTASSSLLTLGNQTVTITGWTSTITTSIVPRLTLTLNATVSSTSSDYTETVTAASGGSTSTKMLTSPANPPGVNSSIITKEPSNMPFPIPSNTSIDWQSTTDSRSLSETAQTAKSQDAGTTWSAASSALSNGNSRSSVSSMNSTTSEQTLLTPSATSGVSVFTVTTHPSLNITSTSHWSINSTVSRTTILTTVTSTVSQAWNSTLVMTWSGLSTDIETLSSVTTVTPPSPFSRNGTTMNISSGSGSPTATDVLSSTTAPPFPGPFNSTTVPSPGPGSSNTSTIENSVPPFPRPWNSTMSWTATGTGVSLSHTGTGSLPTVSDSEAGDSTAVPASTPRASTPFNHPNSTFSETSTRSLTSIPSTPLFPVSNSTTHMPSSTRLSIPPPTLSEAPWTTWSTWSLTAGISSSTSTHTPPFPASNSTMTLWGSTDLTRTTISLITSIVTNAGASEVSKSATSISGIWTNTTISEPWTSFETPGLSRTVVSSETVTPISPSNDTRTAASLTNTADDSTASLEATSGAQTGLTTGSLTTISSSSETSGGLTTSTLTVTLNQTVTGFPISPMTTSSSCESSATASSTCTEWHSPPTYPPPSTFLTSTNCSTQAGRTAQPSRTSLACNTTSIADTTTSCSTFRWSNGTRTFAAKGTSIRALLTTLKTVTTHRAEDSASGADPYPVPTGTIVPLDSLPDDPNYPWGKDSPVHRHRNVSDLGIGTGEGGLSPRAEWRLRWENMVDRLKSLWRRQTLETEE
ncbi:hypothetical protein NM208_g8865 [Fusarium decemcellulare]|uniref:Uncharacterized protein n=1 Tax=Fusarium decemcellulare TaxID=57161 RepID=A0ACC1S3Q4_9HYPO|nr:hypothetical protein NM208_g8865 [Fusarium decemcellulare]